MQRIIVYWSDAKVARSFGTIVMPLDLQSSDDLRPLSVRHEAGFTVVTDKYGEETHIPSADINKISCTPFPKRGHW